MKVAKNAKCWVCGLKSIKGKIFEQKSGQFVGWLCEEHADRAVDISDKGVGNGR